MADELPISESDAEWVARQREVLPTTLGTQEIRDQIAAGVRARSVFVARGTNAIFLSKLKEVVTLLAGGELDEASARLALLETLKALGYTPEGGFPDDPPGTVPPAVAGSIEDLSSFRRLDLIVRTQYDLMAGAGQQWRGQTPDRLEAAPAWELIRIEPKMAPRDWPARWRIAGGARVEGGRMIALKGDPVWGELGSSGNFDDALDVDHPPFAFRSGMGWREISRAECQALGVTGPSGETIDEWFASRPVTLRGELPLPSPSLSLADIDPAVVEEFKRSTGATDHPLKPGVMDFSDLDTEEAELRARFRKRTAEAYQKKNPNYQPVQ